jgi:hypothetical protein
MLTLFSIPKAFRGEFSIIQRNAILSWTRLQPQCEIILLGNEEGVAETAALVGASHVPELTHNDYGTPLVSSIFSVAEQRARFPNLCYVNADIILLGDFIPAVREILSNKPQSLIVGQRWNLDLREVLSSEGDWERRLRAKLDRDGIPEPRNAIDYFVFSRGLFGAIPPFAIGRTAWDQWLIYRARSQKIPVVDASKRITAIHQNHGYSHYATGKHGIWNGVEGQQNRVLAEGWKTAFTLNDATHKLTGGGIRRRLLPFDTHRYFARYVISRRWARPIVHLKKALFPAPQHSKTAVEVPLSNQVE